MTSREIRKKFLDFSAEREHAIVPSSSLIPDDPSVLLTTAGMQQFKPYYTGQADPLSTIHGALGRALGSRNAASVQKSFRTSDIEEVGDQSHLTFFEMLGNFSFGGYFKEEAIRYAYDFIRELDLPIDYVSVFEGDREVPPDTESEKIWRTLGVTNIKKFGRKENFWGPTGAEGPCGPTTEIYVDGSEIWNLVFNEYYQYPDKRLEKLKTPGVDTGMGLERLVKVVQKVKTIFETDLFRPLLELLPSSLPEQAQRIIVDHLRGSTFLLADGVRPSNKEAGYILRRLIRRAVLYERRYDLADNLLQRILGTVIAHYQDSYPELKNASQEILKEFQLEQEKFRRLLTGGLKRIREAIAKKKAMTKFAVRVREDFGAKSGHYINLISGEEAFDIWQSSGIPPELIQEELAQEGYGFHRGEFRQALEKAREKHREISRAGSEAKFGGHGLLLNTGELKARNEEEVEKVTRLHTATHLLHAALRKVLGEHVKQMGSDITAERLRFDFTHRQKLTPDELEKITALVNDAVKRDLPVTRSEMPYEQALKTGALAFFREKYPAIVSVYTVGDPANPFSREFCGGPHVSRTAEIGTVRIVKEEAVGAGMRRIRATVD